MRKWIKIGSEWEEFWAEKCKVYTYHQVQWGWEWFVKYGPYPTKLSDTKPE